MMYSWSVSSIMPLFVMVVLCLASLLRAEGATCAPVTEEQKVSLSHYVERRYRLPAQMPVSVSEVSTVEGSCYQKLHFIASGLRRFSLTLYLTPDRKFLVSELNDVTVDPIAEEKRQAAARRSDLERNDGCPVLGRPDAPITIVVFSDFQCPYCKSFAEMAKQVVAEESQVKLVFRNMPLSMHQWARPAAELGLCVQMQKPQAFWQVHDYFFEHQQELNVNNLLPKTLEFVKSEVKLSLEPLQTCMSAKLASAQLDRDLALAEANQVQGTPTVFVNGKHVNGTPTREHLLTLIREVLHNGVQFSAQAGTPGAYRPLTQCTH